MPDTGSSVTAMAHGSLVGVEPIRQVVTMEDHDEAYYAWKRAGLKDRVVVHVDAHIDFGWMPERDPEELLELQSLAELDRQSARPQLWNFRGRPTDELVGIGNYLNPTLREGIARGVYWVAPDGFFGTPRQRKRLEAVLGGLRRTHPRAFGTVEWTSGSLTAAIYGKRVVVCPLAGLPEIGEAVLLDVDTDFLVIGSMSPSYPWADLPRTRPWIWPEELVARLRARGLRSDFVTVAYSVEGGYTPLGYKHLGDELAMLLRDPGCAPSPSGIASLKRDAALLQEEQRLTEARQACERALSVDSTDAGIHCRLAQLAYEEGRADEAREHYQRAVTLDPSYRTAYKSFGPVHFALDRLDEAEAEYRKALAFDPQDVDAHSGLADLFAGRREWREAILHYRRAVELRPEHGRAHLGLGRVYATLQRWSKAEDALTRALTSAEHAGAAQYRLGLVYAQQGRGDEALTALKAAKRHGVRNIRLFRSLGRLYLRKRNLYQASRHYGRALRLLLAMLSLTLKRGLRLPAVARRDL